MFNTFAHAGHDHSDEPEHQANNESSLASAHTASTSDAVYAPTPVLVVGGAALLVGLAVFMIVIRFSGNTPKKSKK